MQRGDHVDCESSDVATIERTQSLSEDARVTVAVPTRTNIKEHGLRCREMRIGIVSKLCHIPPETPGEHRHSYEGSCCQVLSKFPDRYAHLRCRRRTPAKSRARVGGRVHHHADNNARVLWASGRTKLSRAGGCRFAWSSTQATTNSYSCQSQRTDHHIT